MTPRLDRTLTGAVAVALAGAFVRAVVEPTGDERRVGPPWRRTSLFRYRVELVPAPRCPEPAREGSPPPPPPRPSTCGWVWAASDDDAAARAHEILAHHNEAEKRRRASRLALLGRRREVEA